MSKTDPIARLADHLNRVDDKLDTLTANMATIIERVSDYPKIKEDVQGLKRFRAWYLGTAGVGLTSAVGWFSGIGKLIGIGSAAAASGNVPGIH